MTQRNSTATVADHNTNKTFRSILIAGAAAIIMTAGSAMACGGNQCEGDYVSGNAGFWGYAANAGDAYGGANGTGGDVESSAYAIQEGWNEVGGQSNTTTCGDGCEDNSFAGYAAARQKSGSGSLVNVQGDGSGPVEAWASGSAGSAIEGFVEGGSSRSSGQTDND